MPYTPTNFNTSAYVGTSTVLSQYVVQINTLMSDVAAYLLSESTKISTDFATNTGYSGALLDQYFYGLNSRSVLTGGGTITVDASSNVLWSQKFVTAANGYGASIATVGYFDITCPTSGTITGVGGATNKTATASGIPLTGWEALYYILPLGSSNVTVAANFRVVGIGSAVTIPPSWVKIAQRNNDGNYIEFTNCTALRAGTSINTNQYDVLASDVSGLSGVYAPLISPSFTTPDIGVATGTSFNGITALSSTSPNMNGTAAVGTSPTVARADHVHPTDTTIALKAPIANPAFTGTGSIAGGMSFGNAAQAGGTVLDWYEEGMFTPVIAGATTAGAGTYTVQLGRFTRIGNRVEFNLHITITAHTGTGAMLITGLPYLSEATANNYSAISIGYCSNLTFTNANVGGVILPATSKIALYSAASAGVVAAIAIDVAHELVISGTYQV
jgi:hypothetical protein